MLTVVPVDGVRAIAAPFGPLTLQEVGALDWAPSTKSTTC